MSYRTRTYPFVAKYLLTNRNRLLTFPEDLASIHLCNSGSEKGRYKLYKNGNNLEGFLDEITKLVGNNVEDLLELGDLVITRKGDALVLGSGGSGSGCVCKYLKTIKKLGGVYKLYKVDVSGSGDYKLIWEDTKNHI